MTKIVHFNYNSDKNVNIGDEAHVLAIQDSLRERFKDATIIDLPISFLCHYQLPPFPFSQNLPLFVHNRARILRSMSYSRLLTKVNNADLVVIGGGGVYMDHLLPFNISLIKQIKTPIVIWGAGYNRNFGAGDFTQHQKESVKILGLQAKLQSVRDSNTKQFLETLDVHSELVGDPAMFLKKSPLSPSTHPNDTLHVAINVAAHGWKQQALFEPTLIESYVAAIERLQNHHNATFSYFMHHPGEQRIVELLKDRGIVFKDVVNTNARETKAYYSKTHMTISMMLHSTILAFGEGVPSICIGYDDKNKEFMELTGQASRYISVKELDPEVLIKKAEEAIAALKDSTSKIKARYSELKSTHDTFSYKVPSLLQEKST